MKDSLFAILSILLASACAPINKTSSSQVNEKSSSQGSESTSSLQETPKWNGEVKGNTFKLVGIVIENERLFLESLQSMKLSVSSIEEGKTAIERCILTRGETC